MLQDADLHAYFSRYGTVILIKIFRNGNGFIHFSSPMEADRAFNDGAVHVDVDGTSYRQHQIKNELVLVRHRTVDDAQEKGNVSNHGE